MDTSLNLYNNVNEYTSIHFSTQKRSIAKSFMISTINKINVLYVTKSFSFKPLSDYRKCVNNIKTTLNT